MMTIFANPSLSSASAYVATSRMTQAGSCQASDAPPEHPTSAFPRSPPTPASARSPLEAGAFMQLAPDIDDPGGEGSEVRMTCTRPHATRRACIEESKQPDDFVGDR